MAYVNNPWQDEDENSASGTPAAQKQLSNQNSGYINQGSAQPAATDSKPGGEKRSSGSWTNLMSYVDANKGNDEKMASKVGTDVGEKASELNTGTTDYSSGFKAAADTNTLKQNDSLVDAIKNAPTNVKKDDFSQYYNGTYQGPTDTTNYNTETASKLNNDISSFQGLTSKADTNEGRNELLKNSYNRPSYSQGEQNLDSFIVGGSNAGATAMQGIKDQYKDTASSWDALKNSLTDYGAQAKGTTEAAVNQVKGAYDTSLGNANNYIGSQAQSLAQQNAGLDQQYNTLKTQLNSADPKIRAQGYSALGLTAQQGEYLRSQGLDVLNRTTSNATRQSLGDILDQESIDNYNALQGLTDRNSEFDFTKNNGSTSAYNLDNGTISKGAEASKNYDALQSQYKAEQQKLDSLANMNGEQLAATLGIPLNELKWFSTWYGENPNSIGGKAFTEDKWNGFLNSIKNEILSKKSALQVGDIASQGQKNSWNSLINDLGLANYGGLSGITSHNAANSYQSIINDLKSRYDYNKVKSGEWKPT